MNQMNSYSLLSVPYMNIMIVIIMYVLYALKTHLIMN